MYLPIIAYLKERPFNVELNAAATNIILIYKYHINVNHKMDQLHQPGGMGNDFWRDPVSVPQSTNYGDWGTLTGSLQK